MKRAVVVGSGAGGATVARELQGAFQVTVLEAGRAFGPFIGNLTLFEKLRRGTGLFFHKKQIEWVVPSMKIGTTVDGMVLVTGINHGGSTALSTGSALRQDHDLKAIGVNLDAEFAELSREIPVYTEHRDRWHAPTLEAFEVCRDMGLSPEPTPKMVHRELCIGCGTCVLGCPRGAKWDSREFLDEAVGNGAKLASGVRVKEVVVENGRVVGVVAARGRDRRFYPAELVVLAAGGLGTPAILEQSGIGCQPNLFVDPVLCVATRWENARQNREIPMPFTVQADHFMVSPYFDFLSFFFNPRWRLPAGDIYSLMIKLADSGSGSVSAVRVHKPLLGIDRARLNDAVDFCREILRMMGRRDKDIFLGTLNAGHPGGTLPLTEREARTLHHESLPENLYVADATLLPRSLGNPPILTIAALAKRIGRLCRERAA